MLRTLAGLALILLALVLPLGGSGAAGVLVRVGWRMATGRTAETPAAKIALSASPSRARMSPPVIMKAVVIAAKNERPYEASIALILLSIIFS